MKEQLKQRTDAAIEKGVFGSPFFLADGESFWGWDRLPMLEQWLRDGHW
jgi:2-hydroxychromene-2-carboxylate isomerase